MQVKNLTKQSEMFSFIGDRKNKCKRRIRYKHIEQASNETLFVYSVKKAHDEVVQGNKMRMYNAIPAIGTGIITTSIALAQPGKLATKVAAGLGFLALSKGIDIVQNVIGAKDKDGNQKKPCLTFALASGLVIGAAALVKGLADNNAFGKFGNFIKSESSKFCDEVNNTKLAKFNNKKLNPVIEKHPVATTVGLVTETLGVGFACAQTRANLAESMTQDIKENIKKNFTKAKIIQQIVKREFDLKEGVEI